VALAHADFIAIQPGCARRCLESLRDVPSVRPSKVVVFEHDDAAIDHVGGIDRRHAMEVRQGDRHVALFPPFARPTPFQTSRHPS
jgi:hypothetical protein